MSRVHVMHSVSDSSHEDQEHVFNLYTLLHNELFSRGETALAKSLHSIELRRRVLSAQKLYLAEINIIGSGCIRHRDIFWPSEATTYDKICHLQGNQISLVKSRSGLGCCESFIVYDKSPQGRSRTHRVLCWRTS